MKRLIYLFVAAIALCSCERTMVESLPIESNMLSFTASCAQEETTKTDLQSDRTSIWWSVNDKINVFYGNKYSGEFTSRNTEPAAQATFTGELSGTPTDGDNTEYWAVYPYDENNTCDGESVVLTVPSEQNGVAGSFANGIFPAIAKSNGTELSFYNVCGGVRFSVTQEGITSIVFKSNNGEALTGKLQVAFGDDGKPFTKSIAEPVDSVVVYAPEGGFAIEENYFAIMMPQVLAKGLSIMLYKGSTAALIDNNHSISVIRSRFGVLDEIDNDVVFPAVEPEAVDLGLSVKWASFNLGASQPEEYGDYYAWGEIETYYSSIDPLVWKDGKESYSWSFYKWCNGSNKTFTKYNIDIGYGIVDNKTVLESEDDVAHVTLGDSWRMPTYEEWQELVDNCTWTWTTLNGIYGRKVKSRVAGYENKWIFLPSAGCITDSNYSTQYQKGYYWSSSLGPQSHIGGAWSISFDSSTNGIVSYYDLRYLGYSIRPVKTSGNNPYPVKGVALDKDDLHFFDNNSSQKLFAGIWPSNAADKSVIWSSSDASVATVAQDGTVTSVGTGSAIITVKTNDGGYVATCTVTVGLPASTPDAIDLGLSVKWASYNLGATKPEEFGDYYAWGEQEPHYITQDPLLWKEGMSQGYSWSTYKWCNGSATTLTKYNVNSGCGIIDNKNMLDPEDDVAYIEYGGEWRIPTNEEWEELITKCQITTISENGVKGWLFTGPNSNSIFIPFAGYWSGNRLSDSGAFMNVWSSSLCENDPQKAWRVRFSAGSGTLATDKCNRQVGQSIRPVCGRLLVPVTSITLDKSEMVITELNQSLPLTATITPSNATNIDVAWTSSNTDVAIISQDGTMTAVGYGTATITATTDDGGFTATCTVMVTAVPEAVDLGLSVKWASFNIGSTTPSGFGKYYAWGELKSKSEYSWSTYKWCNGSSKTMTKYCYDGSYGYEGYIDEGTELEKEDDIAYIALRGNWRIPTNAEWKELKTQCTWTWTSMDGHNGYLVKGPNNNTIFLPAAGYYDGTIIFSSNSYLGAYWSSSLHMGYPYGAYALYFDSKNHINDGMGDLRRYHGLTVRPVTN